MSFITRFAPATRLSLAPARSSVLAATRPALFSTTAQRSDKGPIEATKDTLKKADRVVSNAAVKGIEVGEKATHKIQDTFSHGAKKVEKEGAKAAASGAAAVGKEKAKETADQAKDKAQQAKEKTIDLGQQAREEAEELSGKA